MKRIILILAGLAMVVASVAQAVTITGVDSGGLNLGGRVRSVLRFGHIVEGRTPSTGSEGDYSISSV
jgi:predicted porin